MAELPVEEKIRLLEERIWALEQDIVTKASEPVWAVPTEFTNCELCGKIFEQPMEVRVLRTRCDECPRPEGPSVPSVWRRIT